MRVIYMEPVPPDVEAIVRECLPERLRLRLRGPDETPEEAVREADFILVATTRITAAVVAAASRARLIQHQGVGYDNIDVAAAARAGIPVALTPEGTSTPVAEHVFLLMLSLYRRLFEARDSLRQGRWLQWELRPRSYDLQGKTLGIVGMGKIGREVAMRARAFGCRLLYTDVRRAPAGLERDLDMEYLELDSLLARSDIVTLHAPLDGGTRGLIGERELARMRPSAVLINAARGGLVDEGALYRALAEGRLAGAGLDVFEREPPDPGLPLLALENVVATPHVAAGTRDALATKMEAAFANMLRVAAGEAPRNQVAPAPGGAASPASARCE